LGLGWGGLIVEWRGRLLRALVFILEENGPVGSLGEQIHHSFGFSAEELPARFEFKLDLFSDQLGRVAIHQVAD
jgi:hypothetical protein